MYTVHRNFKYHIDIQKKKLQLLNVSTFFLYISIYIYHFMPSYLGQRPRTSHSLPALRNPSRERTLERYTSVEQRPKTAGTQLHFPKSVSLPTCVQRSHTVPINGKKSL